ncbi:MAG TPA: phosphatidylinositol-specific phospholipase C domain-containing protein [Candidatus Babeliales bacterium]|nr:phosphatidylinositol-specific phospholipase C domain-containing protein [Candidatus Babeliales bacterium]
MKIYLGFCLFFAAIVLGEDQFIMPSLDRRYDHVCWLASHNAYAAERHGYIYANQYYTLAEQLELGVRQFELDLEKKGSRIRVCHGSYTLNKFIQPFKKNIDFKKKVLSLFKEFLEKHPNEIITITIENRVTKCGILDEHLEQSGIAYLILKPEDWNPIEKEGWPTLQWMVEHNKRLILFNDIPGHKQGFNTHLQFAATKYTYFQWATIAQNQWAGVKDFTVALKERLHSKTEHKGCVRYLFELDHFALGGKILGGSFSRFLDKLAYGYTPFVTNYKKINGAKLQAVFERVLKEGLDTGILKGRYPNFIKVDYVNEGNPMKLVNYINELANDPEKRLAMFSPIYPH